MPSQPCTGTLVTRLPARVLAGLFAGFFLTWTMTVTVGFAMVDDVTYVTVFQAVNANIMNPAFGIVFFLTVPMVLAAALHHRVVTGRTPLMLLAGAALLAGVVVVTVSANIPLNEALATVDVSVPGAATQARADFESPWNAWNLVRTVLAVAGASLVVGARDADTGRATRRVEVGAALGQPVTG